jgi:hypothetical protein
MPTSGLKDRVDRSFLAFLWRQWVQLGVSGEPVLDRWAIDPEVLLVLTMRLGGRDPRLFDEVLDWLCLNGKLISVQRLRNLTKEDQVSRTLVDAALAWAGAHNPVLHGWRDGPPPPRPGESVSPGPVRVRQPDPILEEFGVRWPRVEPSGNSGSPDTSEPASFCFKLRSFFGVGSRAEIVRFFLTAREDRATANRVADVTRFAKRNVYETLVALEEAGPIITERRGNEILYSLHPAGWWDVLDLASDYEPAFLDWVALMPLLIELITWLDEKESLELSSYMLASEARELIGQIGPNLRSVGVTVPDGRSVVGGAYWEVFGDIVNRLRRLLEGSAA